jgi:hypothetical protein
LPAQRQRAALVAQGPTAARPAGGIAGTLHPSIRPAIKAGPPLRTASRDITRLLVGCNPVEIHRRFFAARKPPNGGRSMYSANNLLMNFALMGCTRPARDGGQAATGQRAGATGHPFGP